MVLSLLDLLTSLDMCKCSGAVEENYSVLFFFTTFPSFSHTQHTLYFFSHTHTHTHTHTRTHTHPFTVSTRLSTWTHATNKKKCPKFLPNFLRKSLSTTPTHFHTHTHSLSLSFCLSVSVSHILLTLSMLLRCRRCLPSSCSCASLLFPFFSRRVFVCI